MRTVDVSGLRAALEELERRLRDFRAPIVEHLQPGLAVDEIQDTLARFELIAPVELETLWAWHDGTDSDDYSVTQLFGHRHLIGLEQAVGTHLLQRKICDEIDYPQGYPRGWFPALRLSFDGAFLAADCSGDPEEESLLYVVDPHAILPDDPPRPAFSSLRHFVDRYIRFFDLGLVVRDEIHGGADVPFDRLPDEFRTTSYW